MASTTPDTIYGKVTVECVVAEDLRDSSIPNYHLWNAWIAFVSKKGLPYNASHNYGLTTTQGSVQHPSIQLTSTARDAEDFEDVASIVACDFEATLIGVPKHRGWIPDLCQTLTLEGELTQGRIAVFSEWYARRFDNVRISSVMFRDIPRSVIESSGYDADYMTGIER